MNFLYFSIRVKYIGLYRIVGEMVNYNFIIFLYYRFNLCVLLKMFLEIKKLDC